MGSVMMNKSKLIAAILFCGVLFFGCANDEAVKKDMGELKSQIIEMQKSIADTNLRMEELSNSIFILQEGTKSNKEALNRMRQPTIVIQEHNPAERNLYADQDAVNEPLPQGGQMTPNYGTDSIKGSVATTLPVSEAPLSGTSEFDMARGNFIKKNYGLAVFDFNSFLSKNPSGQQGEQAQYYLGMSYFNLNEFSQAVREWNTFLQRYPSSTLTPDVTYHIGVAYNTLGEKEKARTFFDQVVEKYKGTPWAAKAAGAMQ